MRFVFRKTIFSGLLLAFVLSSFGPIPTARADEFLLPRVGSRVHLSSPLNPTILKGIKVDPNHPFRFDFVLDPGDSHLSADALSQESTKLIKYFLASLTIPEKDLWVNLSPYEKDRIIPDSFGVTEMGRDLLAEDYILKQITASLIYPEDEIGKKFWKRIYEEAKKKYGTTTIPVNTFNKVWIVPDKAVVYENTKAGTAYVIESKLKVMLESDYLLAQKDKLVTGTGLSGDQEKLVPVTNLLGSQIIREIVIPELTKEINENKNFAKLRQVYNSLILATWYKKKIKDSILAQVYSNQNKTAGINITDPQEKEKIYQQYLLAFKKGVYSYIKEEVEPTTQQVIPRKYFSGGMNINPEQVTTFVSSTDFIINKKSDSTVIVSTDVAMASDVLVNVASDKIPLISRNMVEAKVIVLTDEQVSSFKEILKNLKVPLFLKLTDSDVHEIVKWLGSKEILPSKELFKKFWVSLQYIHKIGKHRLQPFKFFNIFKALADHWKVDNKQINFLFLYFVQRISNIEDVSSEKLYEFIKSYLEIYESNELMTKKFFYITNPEETADQRLSALLSNMDFMEKKFSQDFIGGKNDFKMPIEGTPYYIGLHFGLGDATFGVEISLGKLRDSLTVLSGKFFRVGFDTDGKDAIRNVRIGGVLGQSESIQEFWKNMGISPADFLLLIELEMARRFGLKDMVAVRPEILSRHSQIGLNYRQIYKGFGINKKHPLGRIKSVNDLTQIWDIESKKNPAILKAIELIAHALDHMQEMPVSRGQDYKSEVVLDQSDDEALLTHVDDKFNNPYGLELSVSRGLKDLDESYSLSDDLQGRIRKTTMLLVGVGRGYAAMEMALRHPNLDITAINKEDKLYSTLETFKTKFSGVYTEAAIEDAYHRIKLTIFDADSVEARREFLGNQSFDMVVFGTAVIPYFTDKKQAIEDFYNDHLNPNGIYAFEMYGMEVNYGDDVERDLAGPFLDTQSVSTVRSALSKCSSLVVDRFGNGMSIGYSFFKVRKVSAKALTIPLKFLKAKSHRLFAANATQDKYHSIYEDAAVLVDLSPEENKAFDEFVRGAESIIGNFTPAAHGATYPEKVSQAIVNVFKFYNGSRLKDEPGFESFRQEILSGAVQVAPIVKYVVLNFEQLSQSGLTIEDVQKNVEGIDLLQKLLSSPTFNSVWHGEGGPEGELKDHLKLIIAVLNSVDSPISFPEIPQELRDIVQRLSKSDRTILESLIVYHDLGKGLSEYLRERSSGYSFPNHQEGSYKFLDSKRDKVRYQARALDRKTMFVVRYHDDHYLASKYGDSIAEYIPQWASEFPGNFDEFKEAMELLIAFSTIDTLGKIAGDKRYINLKTVKELYDAYQQFLDRSVISNVQKDAATNEEASQENDQAMTTGRPPRVLTRILEGLRNIKGQVTRESLVESLGVSSTSLDRHKYKVLIDQENQRRRNAGSGQFIELIEKDPEPNPKFDLEGALRQMEGKITISMVLEKMEGEVSYAFLFKRKYKEVIQKINKEREISEPGRPLIVLVTDSEGKKNAVKLIKDYLSKHKGGEVTRNDIIAGTKLASGSLFAADYRNLIRLENTERDPSNQLTFKRGISGGFSKFDQILEALDDLEGRVTLSDIQVAANVAHKTLWRYKIFDLVEEENIKRILQNSNRPLINLVHASTSIEASILKLEKALRKMEGRFTKTVLALDAGVSEADLFRYDYHNLIEAENERRIKEEPGRGSIEIYSRDIENEIIDGLKLLEGLVTRGDIAEASNVAHTVLYDYDYMELIRLENVRRQKEESGRPLIEIRERNDLEKINDTLSKLEGVVTSKVISVLAGVSRSAPYNHSIDTLIAKENQVRSQQNPPRRLIVRIDGARGHVQLDYKYQQSDEALLANPGGIDLTGQLPFEIQNSDQAIKFNINPEQLKQLHAAPGFYPIIMNITPLNDLKTFLTSNPSASEVSV